MTTPTITKHGFMLTKCLTHLQNAGTYARTLAREPTVQRNSRATLTRIANRADAAVREFTDLLEPGSVDIMKREVLPDEQCLQIESITDMIIAMPKGIRDQIENYVQGHYNVYCLNEKK